MNGRPWNRAAEIFLRLTLSAAFLSAVADRFGLWGPPGAPGVAWGAWSTFVEYTAELLGPVPEVIVPTLAWTATIAEVVIALGLLAGLHLRWFAFASGLLLTLFALAMATATGIKAPLDYSVFTAAAGSYILATLGRPRNPM